ncbi:hypothetical protein [Mucilaginibacter sp. UR6-11]|uniref:hypothetical protein n=1 Tax=Mucilaginibacter sp. UR6-11 TaxID=1435644 RepID=UPI001E4645A4|nr:hypothetical protein [Mucilaginibacter sp. UR6-11]MCC8424324.1 hypothetical protein [Mucilaginibacter sp. UR6-11]
MKNIYIMTLAAILCPVFLKAQSNFKPGYIVTLKGDTLQGAIDYREWSRTPKAINFRSTNLNHIALYTPANTLAFGIKGFEYYTRSILPISQDNILLSLLSTGVDTTRITDTVFLKTIHIGGNISLYSYHDDIKERFFIAEKNNQPTELIRHIYLDPQQSSQVVNVDSYKRQLQRLAAIYQPGNTTILEDINGANYTSKELEKIVSKINGSDGKSYPSTTDKEGVQFFGGIGIVSSTINYNGVSDNSTGPQTSSSKAISPKINLGVDLYLNKNIGRWILRTELFFTTDKVSLSYDGKATTPFTKTVKFNHYIATLNPQIVCNIYNTDRTRLYLDAGVAINLSLYQNKEANVTYFQPGNTTVTYPDTFPSVKSAFYTVTTKIGCIINSKFDIYAGYSPSTVLNTEVNSSITLTTYQVGINYRFGKM